MSDGRSSSVCHGGMKAVFSLTVLAAGLFAGVFANLLLKNNKPYFKEIITSPLAWIAACALQNDGSDAHLMASICRHRHL